MTTLTPLRRFLRALTPEQKKQFAKDCGTTLLYLHQLASAKRPNPTLRLTMDIVKHSQWLARKTMTNPLTIEDLLVGAPDEDADDAHA